MKRPNGEREKKNILLLNCANLCLREPTDRNEKRKNRRKIRKFVKAKKTAALDDANAVVAVCPLLQLMALLLGSSMNTASHKSFKTKTKN